MTVHFHVGEDVHFRVRAVNTSGNGEWSEWAKGTVAPNREITDLTLTQNTDATITLTWTQLTGDTGWRAERRILGSDNTYALDPLVGDNGVVTCIIGDDPGNIGNAPGCALGTYTTPAGSKLLDANTYRWFVQVRDANNEFREKTYRQLIVPRVGAVDGLDITLTTRAEVTLSWWHNGSAVTRHEIQNKAGTSTRTYEQNCPDGSVTPENPCTFEIGSLALGAYDVTVYALHQYGYRSDPYPTNGQRYITSALLNDPAKPVVTAVGSVTGTNRAKVDFAWTKPATGFPSSFDNWDAVRVQKRERDSDRNWKDWELPAGHSETKDNPTSTTWTNLSRSKEYSFRGQLKAKTGRWWGPWSDPVELTTPSSSPPIGEGSPDYVLDNGATTMIDLPDESGASGLRGYSPYDVPPDWAAEVVTWHIPSGTCRTGNLNQIARNKLTGTFNGGELFVTAGDNGAHILMLHATGTVDGETVDLSYKIHVGNVTTDTVDVSEVCAPRKTRPKMTRRLTTRRLTTRRSSITSWPMVPRPPSTSLLI